MIIRELFISLLSQLLNKTFQVFLSILEHLDDLIPRHNSHGTSTCLHLLFYLFVVKYFREDIGTFVNIILRYPLGKRSSGK